MARTRARVTLHVRGSDHWGHGENLLALARSLQIGDRVELLPMASPFRMVEFARQYDIGLSLEADISESRRRCLTNKIFTYLLAGRPILMSDTPAQTALAGDLGQAAALVSLSDPASISDQLDRWALSPGGLHAAREAAWQLARTRYNWQVEQQVFLASVDAGPQASRNEIMPTVKQQIGAWLIPRLPLNPVVFRTLRLELSALRVNVLNMLHPRYLARRRALARGRDLLVNVGCGPFGHEGWINLDLHAHSGVALAIDCRRSLPLADDSCRGIHIEHYFEHLEPTRERPRFLAECRRCLMPGGISGSSCPMPASTPRPTFPMDGRT